MKSILWFLTGVIGGFAAAHLLNRDPRGHEVLADIDARITEFTDRVGDAYRSQEAKFGGGVDAAQDDAIDAADLLTPVDGSTDSVLDAATDIADDAPFVADQTGEIAVPAPAAGQPATRID